MLSESCALCGGDNNFQVEDLPVGPRWFCTEKCYAQYAGLPVKESGYYGLEAESFEAELDGIELPVCCGQGMELFPYDGDIIITCQGYKQYFGYTSQKHYCGQSKRLGQLQDGVLWDDCGYCGSELWDDEDHTFKSKDGLVCKKCYEEHYKEDEEEDFEAEECNTEGCENEAGYYDKAKTRPIEEGICIPCFMRPSDPEAATELRMMRRHSSESFEAKETTEQRVMRWSNQPYYSTAHTEAPTVIMHPKKCNHFKTLMPTKAGKWHDWGTPIWHNLHFYETIEEMFIDQFQYLADSQIEGMHEEGQEEDLAQYNNIKTIGDARKFLRGFGFKLDFAPCFRKETDYDSKALNALPINIHKDYNYYKDNVLFHAETKKINPLEKAGLTGVASGATMEGLELALAADSIEKKYFTRYGFTEGGKEWGEMEFTWMATVNEWKPIGESEMDEYDLNEFREEKEYVLVNKMLKNENSHLHKYFINNPLHVDEEEFDTQYEVLNEDGEIEELGFLISWAEPDIEHRKSQYYDYDTPLYKFEFLDAEEITQELYDLETKDFDPIDSWDCEGCSATFKVGDSYTVDGDLFFCATCSKDFKTCETCDESYDPEGEHKWAKTCSECRGDGFILTSYTSASYDDPADGDGHDCEACGGIGYVCEGGDGYGAEETKSLRRDVLYEAWGKWEEGNYPHQMKNLTTEEVNWLYDKGDSYPPFDIEAWYKNTPETFPDETIEYEDSGDEPEYNWENDAEETKSLWKQYPIVTGVGIAGISSLIYSWFKRS